VCYDKSTKTAELTTIPVVPKITAKCAWWYELDGFCLKCQHAGQPVGMCARAASMKVITFYSCLEVQQSSSRTSCN